MSAEDDTREPASRGRLFRQRLWGAAVLIALAVIVLPLLLDGSGSESRFRELEAMREAPPSVQAGNGSGDASGNTANATGDRAGDASGNVTGNDTRFTTRRDASDSLDRQSTLPQQQVPPLSQAQEQNGPALAAAQPSTEAPSAWIVQAGSFRREVNAISLRDRLRDEGFASFVNQRAAGDGVYRVNVGPMISRERADTARQRVDELLGRESFVGRYP